MADAVGSTTGIIQAAAAREGTSALPLLSYTLDGMWRTMQADGKPITENWHYAFRIYHL